MVENRGISHSCLRIPSITHCLRHRSGAGFLTAQESSGEVERGVDRCVGEVARAAQGDRKLEVLLLLLLLLLLFGLGLPGIFPSLGP